MSSKIKFDNGNIKSSKYKFKEIQSSVVDIKKLKKD